MSKTTPLSVRCTHSAAYWFVVRLRKSARIVLKFYTGMFLNMPDTMVMMVSRVGDRTPLGSLYAYRFVVRERFVVRLRKKCSDRAQIVHWYVFEHARRDGDARFACRRPRPSRFVVRVPVRCTFKKLNNSV